VDDIGLLFGNYPAQGKYRSRDPSRAYGRSANFIWYKTISEIGDFPRRWTWSCHYDNVETKPSDCPRHGLEV